MYSMFFPWTCMRTSTRGGVPPAGHIQPRIGRERHVFDKCFRMRTGITDHFRQEESLKCTGLGNDPMDRIETVSNSFLSLSGPTKTRNASMSATREGLLANRPPSA